MFKVVSFFTVGTPYEREVQNLIESLERFNIPHDVRGIDSLGSWDANTKHKPVFIREMMDYYNMPIVWVDADARFAAYPQLFEMIDTDIAVYYKTTGPTAKRFGGMELISACMYFSGSLSSRVLIERWIDEQHRTDQPEKQLIEQRALQCVIPAWRLGGGKMSHLPQSYCRIFDAPEDTPVITQHQASRRFGRE